MTTLSKKLLGYALGRTVTGRRSAADCRDDRGRIEHDDSADLAVKIVTSRQFRHRAGEEPQ